MKEYEIIWHGGLDDEEAILRFKSTSLEHAEAFAECLNLGAGWYSVFEVREDD